MGRAGLALLAFLGIAAGVAVGDDDPARLVADLGSEDGTRRNEAYLALRERKDDAVVALLVEALPGYSEYSQYLGVFVLEAQPRETTGAAWRKLLRCSSPYLRLCAAEFLHRQDEPGMAAVMAAALASPDLAPSVKDRMLNKLTYGRAPREPALLERVRGFLNTDEETIVICEAIQVAKGLDDKEAMAACRTLLEDRRPGVRAVALAFLHRYDVPRARRDHAEALAQLLRTRDVPYHELWNVDLLLRDRDYVSPAIPQALTVRLLNETDSTILRALAGLLARLRHDGAVPALRKLVDHKNPSVAKAAATAIAELTGAAAPATTPTTLAAKDTEKLTELISRRDVAALKGWLQAAQAARRIAAADALRRMDDFSGLPVVIAELADRTSRERAAAARALGGFRVDAAVEPLLDALEDEELLVRDRARTSLQAVLTALFPYRYLDLARTGYSVRGEPGPRREAVKRIRAWWVENRDRSW